MVDTDTKSALLDCAQDLIQRVGVNAMSYNDLSEAVKIRKASIHYHFPKKEDLIKALVERCHESHSGQYMEIVKSDNDTLTKLQQFADIFEEGVKQNKICLIGMLSVEYATLNPILQKTLEHSLCYTTKIFEHVFMQGIKEGVFSKTIDTHDAAFAYLSFLLGTQVTSRCVKEPKRFRLAIEAYLKILT